MSSQQPASPTSPPPIPMTEKISPDGETPLVARKSKPPPPHGTVEYIVQASETLESISAKCDATPSELVKLNRLALRMVFPGQRIFVPDPVSFPLAESSGNGAEKGLLSPTRQNATLISAAKRRPSHERSHLNIPGHIETVVLEDALVDQADSVFPDTAEETVEMDGGRLDEDCHARFLKINAAFVIEDLGSVTGVLLVTPNAIMFDPNVSDALVIQNGSEKYGAIIPMENILSAAIYSEIVPREVRRNSRVESIPFSSFLAHLTEKNVPEESEGQEAATTEEDNEAIISPAAVVPPVSPRPTRRVSTRSGTLSSGGEEEVVGTAPDSGPRVPAASASLQPGNSMEKLEGVLARTRKLSPFRTKSSPAAEPGKTSDDEIGTVDGSRHKRGGSLAPLRKLSRTLMGRKDSRGNPVTDSEDWSKGMDGIFQRTGSLRASMKGSVSPKIKSFVDYSSGLFNVETTDTEAVPKLPSDSEASSPLPGESFTTWQLRRGLSREDVLQNALARRQKFGYRSVVTMEDKPELFRSIEDLLPKEREAATKPLYLCFRVGTPVNKSPKPVIHGPMESYAKKRLKPEYWFAIEREKAEKFYAFLLHWRPEVYGTENMDPADLGFMLFDEPDEDMNEHFAKDLRGMAKEWEVIAFDEARRRAFFLDREESVLPLPDLRYGPSAILTDEIRTALVAHLPARAEGYPWSLVYSTSAHGFSLKTLYRKMQAVDSPTLFLVKDVHEHVFGAIVSCSLRVAEHFYGTGESLLFTFVPNFQVYNWNGENQYIVRGQPDNIVIGSGSGTFGIWLDEDLYKGRTQSCSTFDNEPLCPCGDFTVKNVEAWCFL